MNTISRFSVLALILMVSACGDKKSDDDSPVTIYGNMTLSDSKGGNDNATVQLTSLAACTRNTTTGRVDVSLNAGGGKPSLTFAIKDYSSTPKVYTCKQAADNATSDSDVGGKFETCMASAAVLASPAATTLNTYAMYRELATAKKFDYSGACSLNVTTATPAIAGTVSCTGLVQTSLEGAPRNPVDSSVTATLKGDFNCTFQ